MFAPPDRPVHPSVRRWLLLVAAMIFVMVVVGGLTRLTESGLSMTEWRPVFGWLPPLTDDAWNRIFDLYKQTPQYKKVFPDLSLSGFKAIFWFEYLHRLLGRIIGAVFFVGFVYLLIRRRIPMRLMPQLVALFILGGLQGALGWYMVVSGLVDRPSVSHYRLAAHLSLAFILYAWIVWIVSGLNRKPVATAAATAAAPHGMLPFVTYIGIAVTIVFGAFVAGLDAGKIYNTFPTMGGSLVPADYFRDGQGWRDVVANPAAVQFNHRVLAIITFVLIGALWWRSRRQENPERKRAATWLLAAVILQAALGIATLLMFVPVWLATLHQAGALILVTFAVLHARAGYCGNPVRADRAAPISGQTAH